MHSHDHIHSHKELTPEELTALLKYMEDHNTHHAEELHDFSCSLETLGKKESSELVHKASHMLEDAARLIKQAIEKLN